MHAWQHKLASKVQVREMQRQSPILPMRCHRLNPEYPPHASCFGASTKHTY